MRGERPDHTLQATALVHEALGVSERAIKGDRAIARQWVWCALQHD